MQVSLSIREGYVPDKSSISNKKTADLGQKQHFSLVICGFKSAKSKFANNKISACTEQNFMRKYSYLVLCLDKVQIFENNFDWSFQICDKYNALHADIYEWFGCSFDKFGRTTTEKQTEVAQSIFWDLYNHKNLREDSMKQLFCEKCSRFLADRFVYLFVFCF